MEKSEVLGVLVDELKLAASNLERSIQAAKEKFKTKAEKLVEQYQKHRISNNKEHPAKEKSKLGLQVGTGRGGLQIKWYTTYRYQAVFDGPVLTGRQWIPINKRQLGSRDSTLKRSSMPWQQDKVEEIERAATGIRKTVAVLMEIDYHLRCLEKLAIKLGQPDSQILK